MAPLAPDRTEHGGAGRTALPGLALGLAGAAAAVWVVASPGWRNAYGAVELAAHPVVVGGVGLALLGLAWATSWRASAAWVLLAAVGQACALQLVFAPPYSVYQRYYSPAELLAPDRGLFALGMAVQAVVTVVALRSLWPRVREAATRVLAPGRVLVLLGVAAFAGVVARPDPARMVWELGMLAVVSAVSAANLLLAAAAAPAGAAARFSAVASGGAGGRAGRWAPWLVAGWAAVVAALLCHVVFERVPHIPDDISYLFQAKYLAAGRLYLPAPPDAAAFEIGQVANDGAKWFAYGFPGWPAVLALGALFGQPWLVNPLLAGVTVLLAHALVKRLYGQGPALAVAVLLAFSPWLLFMSASFLGHPVSVVWTLLALLALEREGETRRGWWGLGAGAALGALFLTRPLEGVLVGAAAAVWALWLRPRRLAVRGLAGAVLGAVLVGGLLFPYNAALTGDPFYPAHLRWTDERFYPGADRLGFGPDIGNVGWTHIDPLPGHGPVDVVINANRNAYMSNVELFGWGFGSLAFVLLAVLLGRRRREDWLFLSIIIATAAGHSFYWFSGGPDIGARYWYQALVPLVVLTVRGATLLGERLRELGLAAAGARVPVFIAAASLAAFLSFVPWRGMGKYPRYRGASGDVRRLAETHGFEGGLVLIRARDESDYASGFVLNRPGLDGPAPVYARDAGPESRAALQAAFPGRPIWIVGYPSPAAHRMEVLAGPLPPESPPGAKSNQ